MVFKIFHLRIFPSLRENRGPDITGKKDFRPGIVVRKVSCGMKKMGGYQLKRNRAEIYASSLVLKGSDSALVHQTEVGYETTPDIVDVHLGLCYTEPQRNPRGDVRILVGKENRFHIIKADKTADNGYYP